MKKVSIILFVFLFGCNNPLKVEVKTIQIHDTTVIHDTIKINEYQYSDNCYKLYRMYSPIENSAGTLTSFKNLKIGDTTSDGKGGYCIIKSKPMMLK